MAGAFQLGRLLCFQVPRKVGITLPPPHGFRDPWPGDKRVSAVRSSVWFAAPWSTPSWSPRCPLANAEDTTSELTSKDMLANDRIRRMQRSPFLGIATAERWRCPCPLVRDLHQGAINGQGSTGCRNEVLRHLPQFQPVRG